MYRLVSLCISIVPVCSATTCEAGSPAPGDPSTAERRSVRLVCLSSDMASWCIGRVPQRTNQCICPVMSEYAVISRSRSARLGTYVFAFLSTLSLSSRTPSLRDAQAHAPVVCVCEFKEKCVLGSKAYDIPANLGTIASSGRSVECCCISVAALLQICCSRYSSTSVAPTACCCISVVSLLQALQHLCHRCHRERRENERSR